MPGHYNPATVLLSFLIACIAGFVAFESVDHTRYSDHPRVWIGVGGITLGLGIWSMHFVGMVAWQPPFPLFFSLGLTLLSVAVAIAASWLAVSLTQRNLRRRRGESLMGALVVGSGICAMHYIGMSALHLTQPPMWHWTWVVLSFIIAVMASWAAMELLERSRARAFSLKRQIFASLIIGGAIVGMHYTGMMAFMPMPGATSIHLPWSFRGETLARAAVGNAMLFTLGLLLVSYRDKNTWLQMATQARFEALEVSRQLESMAAAKKIAASVAHEINNPLEAVTNLLYLIENGEIGSQERDYLTLAQQELTRIAEITTHTLRFYRQQSGPSETSIPQLIESVITLFREAAARTGVTIQKDWPSDIPNIVCRQGEIRQVIANLVNNAIDAMPSGGTLRLAINRSDAGLTLHIVDTGSGIPVAVRGKILQPFFTTKGAAGTGLGLSISAEIIERHGGSLSFISNVEGEDRGTRFSIELPFKLSESATAKS